MNDTDYKQVLEQTKADLLKEQNALGKCMKQQEHHEKRIAGFRASVAALSRMLDEEFVEEDAMGFTDAIREVFKSLPENETLSPTDVRGRLEMLGYDTSKYGNVMASVHTIIGRLVTKGEIKHAGQRGDGKPVYRAMSRLGLTPAPKPIGLKDLMGVPKK